MKGLTLTVRQLLRLFTRCCGPSGPSAEKDQVICVKKQWHKGSIPVQRWCLPGRFSGSLNSIELLCCTQMRIASQHLFLDLDPLTVPLDEGTF